jgi:hypothetical protein
VRHSHILFENTPPMTNRCIPSYKSVINGNIIFWGMRRSSTLITRLCNSYRHRGNCRTTTIGSGPPTYRNSISKLSIKQGSQIMSLTASIDLPWMPSPLCPIPVYMRHLSGPNFIRKIRTSPPPIISWVHVRISPIFTFRTDYYAIWTISVFLQASMQILFGKPTVVGWKDILARRKLWPFFKRIFISQNSDRTSTSISDLALPMPLLSQPSRSKDYTPLFLLPRSLGNPSQWITCLAFHPPSKGMTTCLWSLISFRRWPSSQPTRRISQR